MRRFDRRGALLLGLAGCAALVLGAAPARALTPEAARGLIDETVREVLELVRAPGGPETKAERLRAIMEARAAMPQIARFAAGVAWRDMTAEQQERYARAFSGFIATVYARRFQTYSGETVEIGKVSDAGKRGLIVESRVSQKGTEPILVEWLVSDRGGDLRIADIVIEGVSLVITQREEIAGMLSARGGDVERLITDLEAQRAA